jgi:fumarate hydratase subunit beta
MEGIKIRVPDELQKLRGLTAGTTLLLSGTVYTARDQAHSRLTKALAAGMALPIPLEDQIIYYAGPTPAPPGRPAGSLGPTTASRMDSFTPALLAQGLAAAIGKGPRSPEVRDAFRTHGALYLAAVGGAAALLGACVREMEQVAYADLGAEAVYRLLLEDFPLVIAYDVFGGDIYRMKR